MKRKGTLEVQPNVKEFWSSVQIQFDANNFENVNSVRKALLCNPNLAHSLIPYLSEPIFIDSNLELQTRFQLLSYTAKYNFISLICLTLHLFPNFPQQFLIDPILRSIYE